MSVQLKTACRRLTEELKKMSLLQGTVNVPRFSQTKGTDELAVLIDKENLSFAGDLDNIFGKRFLMTHRSEKKSVAYGCIEN